MAEDEKTDDGEIVAIDLMASIEEEFLGNERAVTAAELARVYGKLALLQELMAELFSMTVAESPELQGNPRVAVVERGIRHGIKAIGDDLNTLAEQGGGK